MLFNKTKLIVSKKKGKKIKLISSSLISESWVSVLTERFCEMVMEPIVGEPELEIESDPGRNEQVNTIKKSR